MKKKTIGYASNKKAIPEMEKKGKNKMENGKQLTLNIYNEKNEREYGYEEKHYEEIQKQFAELMFLKNVLKINYRMSTKTNYDGTYKVTFKDLQNDWKYEFDGINADKLRWY